MGNEQMSSENNDGKLQPLKKDIGSNLVDGLVGVGKLIEGAILPDAKLSNKESIKQEKLLSEGDKQTMKQWLNPETRNQIINAAEQFRSAPEGSDDRIKYDTIKGKLQSLLKVDIDKYIQELLDVRNAERTMYKEIDPEAEGPAGTDGLSHEDLFNKDAPTEDLFK